MTNPSDRVLILGASSGFGAATAVAFGAKGLHVHGVHLDRRSTAAAVASVRDRVAENAASVHFYNVNAADDARRAAVLDHIQDRVQAEGGKVRVLLHSLAFGSLVPLVSGAAGEPLATRKQLDMTMDVMAHSLVHWTRDLVERDLLARGGRIFALTSSGSHQALRHYGPVGAAKAALEAHVRQLALELAPRAVTVNAVLAGVTDTPALRKIPGHEQVLEKALARNPHGRHTRPEDVARCLLALASPDTQWMTGNVIRVDGGEDACA